MADHVPSTAEALTGVPGHVGRPQPPDVGDAPAVLRRLAERADEIPSVALHLPDGGTVAISTDAQIVEWLETLAIEVENGEPL